MPSFVASMRAGHVMVLFRATALVGCAGSAVVGPVVCFRPVETSFKLETQDKLRYPLPGTRPSLEMVMSENPVCRRRQSEVSRVTQNGSFFPIVVKRGIYPGRTFGGAFPLLEGILHITLHVRVICLRDASQE